MSQTRPGRRAGAGGRVRIIGGRWRRRWLQVPAGADLRPTPDRVRETLFNWLGQDLTGTCCLDLFAGTGALGFEAASRGADRVVLVERDRLALEALRGARELLGAASVEIVAADGPRWLERAQERFDVVFLDPPFGQNALPALLETMPARLAPGARVYLESALPVAPGAAWQELRRARAGRVHYQLLQWSEQDASRLPGNV